MVNKAIHLGLNSGLVIPSSPPQLDFISLQLTRISWTLEKMAEVLESEILVASRMMSASFRKAKSLEPILCDLSLEAVLMTGFNNFIRKQMQFCDSKRWSSWPWDSKILAQP